MVASADPSPFLDLSLTIDTRERDKRRIATITDYFELRGGQVKRGTLRDFDYHIEGESKGLPLDLGIEYKTVNDIVSNWKELPERFMRAVQHVDHLALFVEGNIVTVRHQDDGALYLENTCMGEVGEIMPFTTYQSKMWQWSRESGLYLMQYNALRYFGPTMENLINHINRAHPLLELPRKDPRRMRLAFYQQIPGIGPNTALALTAHPLLYWYEHEDELVQIAKPSKAGKILDFIGKRG